VRISINQLLASCPEREKERFKLMWGALELEQCIRLCIILTAIMKRWLSYLDHTGKDMMVR
jgi:hypothetical protein